MNESELGIEKESIPFYKDQDFHFLYEFNQSKNKLGYTTHQKLESGLEQLLQG